MFACTLGPLAGTASAAGGNTYFVNSTADTMDAVNSCLTVTDESHINRSPTTPAQTCTFPEAIEDAQADESANPGDQNVIAFTVCGPYVITTQLPSIPANTTTATYDPNGSPYVQAPAGGGCTDAGAESGNYSYANIEGSGNGPNGAAQFPGITLAGSGSVINGLMINGFTDGVVIEPPGNDQFYFSYVGASPFEQGYLTPQNSGNGIEVASGSANNDLGYAPSFGANLAEFDDYGNAGWGIYLDPGSGPTYVGDVYLGIDTSGHLLGPGDEGYNAASDGSAINGDGPPNGNGAGGVYVGDTNGDLIGGNQICVNAGITCSSNIISGNGGPGVEIGPTGGNATVAGNFIGPALNFYNDPETVAPTCQVANDNDCPAPNDGPGVLDLGTNDVIGGTNSADANMIAGNDGPGVLMEGTGGSVENNEIGLDLTGNGPEPNTGAGVQTSDATGNTTGNNTISNNVIGGNTGPGIELDQGSDTVVSNFIGTGGDHQTPVPNAIGILAQRGPESIGTATASSNTIADNTGAGIAVVDPSATSDATGVQIYGNTIFGNGGLGIDLGDDGVTANHASNPLLGPNGWQNYPTLTSASAVAGKYSIHGSISGAPASSYLAIFAYSSSSCDPSGYGQGQHLLTNGMISTDASGNATFGLTGSGLNPGDVVTATATGYGSTEGTSEFSKCITTTGGDDLKLSQFVPAYGSVIADEDFDLDIHISNAGPADASNVVLSDTLPQNATLVSQPNGCPAASGATFKCTVGAIPAGGSVDLHLLLSPGKVSSVTNTATVASDQIQTNTADASSTFTTDVQPNPDDTNQNPGNSNEPAPTFGQYVRIDRQSGSVQATLPNGQTIDLRNYALVPVGTIVQTTHGNARVTAALPGQDDQTSFANFYQGRFKIAQNRKQDGLVTAVMDAPLAGCTVKRQSAQTHKPSRKKPANPSRGKKNHRKNTAKAAKAAKGQPTKRHLWGHAHGQFTIQGARGSATVHGTVWEVIDTCTTTTVKVKTDVVDVRASGNNVPKTAVVTAGHQVVLHAPGA